MPLALLMGSVRFAAVLVFVALGDARHAKYPGRPPTLGIAGAFPREGSQLTHEGPTGMFATTGRQSRLLVGPRMERPYLLEPFLNVCLKISSRPLSDKPLRRSGVHQNFL